MHANRTIRTLTLALGLVAGVLAFTPAADAARGAADGQSRDEIRRMVADEALAAGVPVSLALAVAKVESNFNPRALSSAGARGVMQIMPRTGRDLYGVDEDELWDAELNIRLGIDFLKDLYARYGRWDLALSHYNGGSAVGTPPNARVIPATRGYVDSVLAWHRRFERDSTVVAMNEAKEGLDRTAAAAPAPAATPSSRYWTYDRPAVEGDWRHYLRVADQWLDRSRRIQRGERVDPLGPSFDPQPAAAPNAPTTSNADAATTDPYAGIDPWGAVRPAAPADDPAASADPRQRFRSYLASGRLPWQTMRERNGGASRFGG